MGEAESRRRYALVADDEALIRMDAGMILEDAGFGVYEAADADRALAFLREHAGSIVLLFTDVDMPTGSMDGFGLARETACSWPHISIIVASGRRVPRDGDLPDGARFVNKPFSAEVVIDRLKMMLPHHHKPDPLRD